MNTEDCQPIPTVMVKNQSAHASHLSVPLCTASSSNMASAKCWSCKGMFPGPLVLGAPCTSLFRSQTTYINKQEIIHNCLPKASTASQEPLNLQKNSKGVMKAAEKKSPHIPNQIKFQRVSQALKMPQASPSIYSSIKHAKKMKNIFHR